MKLWIKRAAAALLILVGAVLLIRHGAQLLDWRHLYPDTGKIGAGNLLFLALTLIALALAWISASYLLLDCEKDMLHFLIPAALFGLLMLFASFTMTRAVGEIPCSYTASLAACREDFDSKDFRVDGRSLYPLFPSGELTNYARYEKENVLAESLTRSYDQDSFTAEASRLKTLNISAFRPPQDPREREVLCYQVEQGGTVWQVLVVPKTKTVTYSRFCHPDLLPDFAPQPSVREEAVGGTSDN